MNKTEKFWNKCARKYSKSKIQDMEGYHKTLEDTRKYLGNEKTVLEIGCGTGTTALKLANSVKELIATDISSEMIAISKEKASEQKVENVSFKKSTLSDEALQKESFDVILAYNLVHLLEDTDQVMKRIKELLKPGGVFISKTACLKEKSIFWPVLASIMGKVYGLACIHNFTVADYEGALVSEGFEIIETHSYKPKPIRLFVVARKRE